MNDRICRARKDQLIGHVQVVKWFIINHKAQFDHQEINNDCKIF